MDWQKIAAKLMLENERLRQALAQADQIISAHVTVIDSNPRESWPEGSILEQAISRHETRIRLEAMSGYDEGGIIPPPRDMRIEHSPTAWWKNHALGDEEKR